MNTVTTRDPTAVDSTLAAACKKIEQKTMDDDAM
jgi:hypothetical protein